MNHIFALQRNLGRSFVTINDFFFFFFFSHSTPMIVNFRTFHLTLFFWPPVYPSNCVRDEIRGTHVRLIATSETVCCSRLETCVAHSPRYLGGSLGPVKCSINIEIAILYPARLFSDALLSFDKSLNRCVRSATQDL